MVAIAYRYSATGGRHGNFSMSFEDSDDEHVGLTSVSLGYAGKPFNPVSGLDNHIGGVPVWLNGTPAPAQLYTCETCQSEMDLMVQISAPLDNKWYHRVLYIFSCSSPGCARKDGTIKAVRGIHKNKEIESKLKEDAEEQVPVAAPVSSLGDTLFGSSTSENPFSSGSNPFANPFAKEPETKPSQKEAKQPPKPKQKIEQKGRFLCKDIEVEEEYLTHEDFKMPDNVVIDENTEETEESAIAAGSAGVDPAVEELLTSITDATFGRFLALIDNNPDQILRYDWPLVPIAYTDDKLSAVMHDSSKIPKGLGNGSRQFEVQLVPKLISELETPDMLLEGMEWGTIVVATSKDDVLPDLDASGVGYTQEWVGVQWEKLVEN